MSDFGLAVALTLRQEGGFQKDPNDKGNWTGGAVNSGTLVGTKYGISAAEFPDVDIPNLTAAQAADIYQKKYWNPLYDSIKDQIVADKLFDMGVNEGVGTAVKILQEVLQPQFSDVTLDGNFGPKTLAAVNGSDPVSLLVAYKTALVARVLKIGADNPAERPFIGDWIRRINS